MIDQKIIKRLAMESKVSENTVEMVVKEAIRSTVAELKGADKNYLVDLNSLEITIIDKGQVSKTSLKNIGGRKFALTLRSKIIELMNEISPVKSNKKVNNLEDYDSQKVSDNSERDPYENFRWGGLSGEEAYIGYLNTD